MRAPVCNQVPRPFHVKMPQRRRRVERMDQRERILRERVAYMLWVMANRVE
jgi:hypothetical protein